MGDRGTEVMGGAELGMLIAEYAGGGCWGSQEACWGQSSLWYCLPAIGPWPCEELSQLLG